MSSSVLDGRMLSFKDEESFIKEYSGVSEMKSSKEVQNWISKKGLESLLNNSDDSNEMEEEVLSDTRIIYSDALKAILNDESKVKIGGKTIWLNERNFYVLSEKEQNKNSKELGLIKDELEIYGKLLSYMGSEKTLTSRDVIPNENRAKTFINGEGEFNVPGVRLRHVLDLFNETIVVNNQIQSSKMYLRFTMQYRSCSTWRCTWKTENSTLRDYSSGYVVANNITWNTQHPYVYGGFTGSQTYLFSTWIGSYILANPYQNFSVSGKIQFQMADGWHEIEISWY
ncbi:hypothetical protein [Flavobacterium gyeonganense]|uniref:Uncharacterized protein n=1 Tax=Flavobacterium gyeonganense TaxID=1310418 RepID=A0ABV5H8U7_9FLAO|nr:hypothetical protein [Flavobacterium gyeonganense]